MPNNEISKQDTATHQTLMNAKTFITESHPEVLTAIQNMLTESTTLGNVLTKAALALKLRTKTPDITAGDVKGYKSDMSVNIFAIIKMAHSVCVQTKNTEMGKALDLYSDHFTRPDKIIAVARANEMYKFIHDKKELFTNIADEDYLKATTSTSLFDTMKDVPEMTKNNQKDYGTLLYKKPLKDGRDSVLNMLEMIEPKYSVTYPELVAAFKTVIAIIILGVRKTPVNALLIDEAGNPIPNVKMVRTSKKGKETFFVSDAKGTVARKTHKPGTTNYIAKVAGFIDTPFSIKLKKGITNNFTIILKKKV